MQKWHGPAWSWTHDATFSVRHFARDLRGKNDFRRKTGNASSVAVVVAVVCLFVGVRVCVCARARVCVLKIVSVGTKCY